MADPAFMRILQAVRATDQPEELGCGQIGFAPIDLWWRPSLTGLVARRILRLCCCSDV